MRLRKNNFDAIRLAMAMRVVWFTISGFLISHSYLHSENMLQFLRRRVFRIYPGYIAATLIGGR